MQTKRALTVGLALLITAGMAMAETAQAQDFTGQVVGVRSANSRFGSFGRNVNETPTGDGIEVPSYLIGGIAFVDIQANRVIFGFNPGASSLGFSNTGFQFYDVNNSIAPFATAVFSGVSASLNSNRISVFENAIFVNFDGLELQQHPTDPQTLVQFDVTFGTPTTVPEPSTYALMGTGLLALGGVAARKRQG